MDKVVLDSKAGKARREVGRCAGDGGCTGSAERAGKKERR